MTYPKKVVENILGDKYSKNKKYTIDGELTVNGIKFKGKGKVDIK